MDNKKETLLRQYLDHELSEKEEQAALHAIADDAEMRSMLHFEQRFQTFGQNLRDSASFEVPPEFSNNVIDAIEARQAEASSNYSLEKLRTAIRSLWMPKQISFRPAYALCLLLIALMVSALPFYTNWDTSEKSTGMPGAFVEQVSETREQVWTRFVYIDNEAESIAIAGDFNNWNPADLTLQTINGDQVWTGLIAMERGEHRYMFVKNGENWVTDPLAAIQQDDGFGNKNAVIYL
jgi:hypothetical protein